MFKTPKVIFLSAVLLAQVTFGARADAPFRHDFPLVNGYQVLLGDFHMHTIHSDGSLTTRQRVEESHTYGFDVIAITDHGKTRAYRTAAYVAKPLGMLVIRGCETGIAGNEHIVALNVPFDYKPINAHNWAEKSGQKALFYQDELKKIADSGGVAIYAHPHVGFREPILWAVDKGYIHGVEVKNDVVGKAWNTVQFEGRWCYPSALDWAIEQKLAVIANSDAHGNRNMAKPFGTLLFVKEKTVEAVIYAIKSARTATVFEGMVLGPDKLLSDLISASVKVEKTADGSLTLTNSSPLELKGVSADGREFTLKAYDSANVSVPTAGIAKTLTVRWSNVWVNSKTNLSSSFKL